MLVIDVYIVVCSSCSYCGWAGAVLAKNWCLKTSR